MALDFGKKNAATESMLNELHNLTTLQMKQRLTEALATGEPLPPAELSVIVKFLKDNGIECTPDDMKSKFGDILDLKAPTFEEVEENYG